MGVTGLWRLIEPAGKPVPIETLENKVLAVDISIWLHQMVKGFQDAKGAPMPNAHLLGLFQRLCKLLYFRIKPVFVFDGSYPELKKETIAKRQDNKAKLNSESERLKREILLLLGKKTAIGSLLGKQISPKKAPHSENCSENEDLFKLPELPPVQNEADSSSESGSEEENTSIPVVDLHSIDLESDNFKNLPLREKHDVLIELKETRKMNSWGKLHELPKESNNFSNFQMKRLLKRRKVQECLEETEKEIGQNSMTLNELESLLNDQGVLTDMDSLPTKRIASDNKTRYLMISNVKQALEDAKQKEKIDRTKTTKAIEELNKHVEEKTICENNPSNTDTTQIDEDLEIAIKMSLECSEVENKTENQVRNSPESSLMVTSDNSGTSEDEEINFNFNAAKAYIEQNTDYTSNVISNIVSKTVFRKIDKPKNKVNEILNELKMDTSGETTKFEESKLKYENLCKERILNLSSSDDDEDDAEIIKVKPTETLMQPGKEITPPLGKSCTETDESDSNESDEEFEEVPETSSEQKSNPVVEVNLDTENTIEDDIFADIFKNVHSKDISYSETRLSNDNLKIKESVPQPEIPKITDQTLKSLTEAENFINTENSEIDHIKETFFDIDECGGNCEDSKLNKKISQMSEIVSDVSKNDASDLSNNIYKKLIDSNIVPVPHQLASQELNTMAQQLETEHEDLMHEKNRVDRMGRNISEQMTRDAQELLHIFGIPYIVAPCEAEAQCAFLESVKLTDGTITDDSDIWLFGGKTVYKNFFNQKKLVMQFLSERIDKSFNLSREQLILLALLVGSDYTTGVSGVGPVTALEILAAFSCSKKDLLMFHAATNPNSKYNALLTGLQEFKKWVRSGKKTDDTSLRKKLKNISVGDDFPSTRVVQAYMEPKVETSEDKFTWGEPDLTELTDYVRKKFGWSKNKLDEILNPVLKRLQDRKNQRTMQDYFRRTLEFQSLEDQMSKRVKAAVEKMGDESKDIKPPEKQATKRKMSRKSEKSPEKAVTAEEISSEPSTSNCGGNITRVISNPEVAATSFEIVVPKLARYQEVIPQREKDRLNVLNNKLKAIEMYRKTKLNQKSKKRKRNLPKPSANLSESSDSS